MAQAALIHAPGIHDRNFDVLKVADVAGGDRCLARQPDSGNVRIRMSIDRPPRSVGRGRSDAPAARYRALCPRAVATSSFTFMLNCVSLPVIQTCTGSISE